MHHTKKLPCLHCCTISIYEMVFASLFETEVEILISGATPGIIIHFLNNMHCILRSLLAL